METKWLKDRIEELVKDGHEHPFNAAIGELEKQLLNEMLAESKLSINAFCKKINMNRGSFYHKSDLSNSKYSKYKRQPKKWEAS